MTLAKLLPLAFVMIAGPQILSAIFLATTVQWKKNSAAFVTGAGISVTILVTLGYALGTGASDNGTSHTTVDVVVLLLLVGAAIHTFVVRHQSKPPKWMGKLEENTPKQSFVLGLLLLGLFPGDILTALAVGGYASGQDLPWAQLLVFVGLTLLLLALPALALAAFGAKAQALMPKVRDWMNANSWVISEIVFAIFIALVISSM
jgi:cytochrome c biogenesis protein CcdA